MTIIATDRILLGELLAQWLSNCAPPVSVLKAGDINPDSLAPGTTIIVDGHGVGSKSSFDVIRELNLAPGVRVVLLVDSNSDVVLAEARSAGACGVVCVRDHPAEFEEIITNSRPSGFRVSTMANPPADCRFKSVLTNRQRQTYVLAARGRTDEEIAAALQIAPITAETHRSAVFSRLGVHSYGELALHAVRNGVVSPGEIARESALRRCTRVRGWGIKTEAITGGTHGSCASNPDHGVPDRV